ncbi:MAG: Shikimate dehydrogenase (NADP(+)) [Anaerolineales bacterium]|nr:Shikimate dehydrogenase (NADP(+)) [Anaerolineales bacterium]
MIRLGLTGYPLGHSLSPQIHAAALDACGLQGEYSLYPIALNDSHGLKRLLNKLRAGELQGLNVTIPHKQNVIEYLDELTPTAKAIGAVNTIYFREGKLTGENTDAPGFLANLHRFLRETPNIESRISQTEYRKPAIVLGAGGSARAVVYALLCDGWQVTAAARRIEQARQLARSFPDYAIRAIHLPDLRHLTFDLLINTTPLGMTPDINSSPLPEDFSFPPHALVYDLIYNPRETRLVRDAHAKGLSATTGLGMLVEQAALAFEIWTGHNPPRESLFSVVEIN